MGDLDRPLDASALRDWVHSAVGDLITHTDEINRLNVFPVADADTGTNMLFTLRSALAEANTEAASGGAAAVAAALSTGALHGARGNSGVILSQILRGLSDAIAAAGADAGADTATHAGTDARPVDDRHVSAATLADGLHRAVDLVITSMGGREIPGTIVSVLRAAAAAVREHAPYGLATALAAATEAAVTALEKTPEQLDVLAEAGVVDAGGRGLLVLLDSLRSTITGHSPGRAVYEPAPSGAGRDGAAVPKRTADPEVHPAPHFEVMYLLGECDGSASATLRDSLDQLGESVAIASDGVVGGYSVHVHTDDAGAAVEAGLAVGRPRRIQISALVGSPRLPPGGWERERAVLAVVDGTGAAGLFAGEGACVLSLDPPGPDTPAEITARQLLRAMVDTGAAQVMVLPNGYVPGEELVAGCTAATGWGIEVVPVPSGSMVQGLAALAVHDPGRPVVDDGYTMAQAAGATRHGSVRVATEPALTWAGECRAGDGLGITGDEVLIVADGVLGAATGLIDLLLSAGGELVTVLLGAAADQQIVDLLGRYVHDQHPGTELMTYRTDHHGDVLLIGVE